MTLAIQMGRFCRALRQAGMLVGPASAADALEVLTRVDISDRREVFHALRMLLCHSPRHREAFQALFDAYFGVGGEGRQLARRQVGSLLDWRPAGGDGSASESPVPGRGLEESTADRDLAHLPPEAEAEVTRVVRRLARRLAIRVGRRYRIAGRGRLPALRASLRRSVNTGGELLSLRYRRRKVRRVRLAVVCDVSGSMEIYSRFLLQVVYALQRYLAGVETFAFSTRLLRVTPQLRQGRFAEAIRRAAAGGRWGGGTRIGESLLTLTRQYLPTFSRQTIVIILSDGWDAGEPEVLRQALRDLKRGTRRLVWLNPLLGAPDYKPLTRGMSAALPYLDVFAPCHNLRSLEQLYRHLGG